MELNKGTKKQQVISFFFFFFPPASNAAGSISSQITITFTLTPFEKSISKKYNDLN